VVKRLRYASGMIDNRSDGLPAGASFDVAGAKGTPAWPVESVAFCSLDEAWTHSGSDAAEFRRMVNAVALGCARHLGVELPDPDFARNYTLDDLRSQFDEGSRTFFGKMIFTLVENAIPYQPFDAKTVAAYNVTRDCLDTTTLCHAPETGLYFGRDGKVSACCYSRSAPFGRYPDQKLTEMWFGAKIQQMRDRLRASVMPVGCGICAEQLRAGNYGGLLAGNYDDLATAPRAAWSALPGRPIPPPPRPVYPTKMEFELSNKCNLECAMCNGFFSSSIRANREGLPALGQVYGDAFVEELRGFVPHLKQAKFLGGEPFLIDIYYAIWELLIELNPACDISITTNATVFTPKVQRVLEHLNCQIIVSLDSVDKQMYEGIRRNATLERTLDNLDRITAINRQREKPLSLAVCPMVSNWRGLPELLRFANERGMGIFFNTVTNPRHESLKYLPAAEQQRVVEALRRALTKPAAEIEARNHAALEGLCRQLESWMFRGDAATGEPGQTELVVLR
jgi:MoaA/NifB/PqqE/SkfB family radical SAM enzyme